ncbi:MAG: sodium/solute symporter [Acidobacteriota bacterium]
MDVGILSGADIVVILGSLVLVLWIGLWSARHQDKTARGYFLASDKLPWWLIGTSMVATSVSSEQIVGTVGASYVHGMGVANWEWFTLPVYTLTMFFFVPMYLRNRVATVSEFYHRRFGPLCSDIYGWVMLVAYVFVFLVPVLYGGSLAFADLTGFDFYWTLWISAVLVGLYTVKGGLVSVMWTTFLQCVLLVGGGIVLFVLALRQVPGGWAAMVAANPERFHLYRPVDDPIAPFLGLVLLAFNTGIFYQATNQVMIQRLLGARTVWDGIMGTLFGGFINFARPLVTSFLGFVVFYWIHSLQRSAPLTNQDTAFAFALRHFSPEWGLRGLILAGFLAAVMSTISALVNSSATIFALDIYKRLFSPEASEQQTVRAGRIASLASLVIAALVAPAVEYLGGIFRYFQTGVTYLATPFAATMIMGLAWRRANYHGALFGMIGGMAIQVVVAGGLWSAGISLHWAYVGAIAQLLTLGGIVLVSSITAPPDRSQWEPFVWRPSFIRYYDEGAVRPWYQNLRLWYAIYAAIWVYLYWRFW